MDYPSPSATDFNEVSVLNAAFLALLKDDRAAEILLAGLAADVAGKLAALTQAESQRLSSAPFFLFSLRETDDQYWDEVQSDGATYSLFAASGVGAIDGNRLVSASLGYIWQMAQHNPYTLRLICCASLYWCERIGDQPLMHVISRATCRDDLLELRAGTKPAVWRRLLDGGLSRRDEVRRATQYSVLQALLMVSPARQEVAWRSAACKTRVPVVSRNAED